MAENKVTSFISNMFSTTSSKRKAEENTGESPEGKNVKITDPDISCVEPVNNNDRMESTPISHRSETDSIEHKSSASSENSTSMDTTEATSATISSVSSSDSVNTVLSKILGKITSLESSYRELVQSDRYTANEQKDTSVKINEMQRKLQQEHNMRLALELNNRKLLSRIESMENRIKELETEQKRCNLVFHGFNDSNTRDDVKLMRDIVSCLNMIPDFCGQASRVQFKAFYHLGYYNKFKLRPVKVEFHNYMDVELILRNKRHLPSGVFVNEDLPEERERNRLKMLQIYLFARKNGYKGRCRMELDALVLDNKLYTVDNVEDLPVDLQPIQLCEKRNEDSVVFFGEHSPLSNFHKVDIHYEGNTFNCVEQNIPI